MAGKSIIKVIITGDAKAAIGELGALNAAAGASGGKLAALGKIGLVAGAAVAAVGVAGAVAAFKLGSSFHDAYKTIRLGTGATGKDLEGLKNVFRDVVRTVPTDFGTASEAVAQLNTRTGLTGKGLEKLAETTIRLSKFTKTDLNETIASTTRLFGDWSVAAGDQVATLNKLYRAGQVSGAGIGDLSRNVVQFGAPLRALGFDLDTAAAMFARFEKEGVNIQTVMSGLRFGLKTFAKAGKDPVKAFQEVRDAIKNAATETDANSIAFKTFGVRAGIDVARAIREGRFELTDYISKIRDGSDTIEKGAKDTASFSGKWQLFANRLKVAVEPIATRVFEGMGKLMDRLGPILAKTITLISKGAERLGTLFGPIAAKVESFFDSASVGGEKVSGIMEHLSAAFESAQSTIGPILDYLRDYWQFLWSFVSDVWNTIGATVIDRVQDVFRGLVDFFKGVFEIIRGIFQIFAAIFEGDWGKAWEGIKSVFSGVWHAITAILRVAWDTIVLVVTTAVTVLWNIITRVFSAAWSFLSSIFGGIVSTVGDAIGKVIGFFIGLPGRLLGLLGQIGSAALQIGGAIIDGIVNGISKITGVVGDIASSILGALKHVWNSYIVDPLASAASNFSVLGYHPFDKNDFNFLKLAKGGVVSSPTLAVVGDAGPFNPEVVAPQKMLREIIREEGGTGITSQIIVQGSVYGVDDLHRILDERDAHLIRILRARRS